MRILATVTTNSEDDSFGRVKLKSPTVWEESELIPSLNAINLEIGDIVLVDLNDDYLDGIILGRVRTQNQIDNEPETENDGEIIYQHKNGDNWSILKAKGNSLFFENSKGVKSTIVDDSITLTVPKDVTVQIDGNLTATVKGDVNQTVEGNVTESVKGDINQTVDGNVKTDTKGNSELKVGGNAKIDVSGNVDLKATMTNINSGLNCTKTPIPDGQGPFCGIPACMFSGATHSSSKAQ